MIYTGIGSRETPPDILKLMSKIAEHLASHDWILRSGGADGADKAFEIGCDAVGGFKEIYLPWKNFNGSTSDLYMASTLTKAYELASTLHPAWDKCNQGAKKLHARNTQQILGVYLETPTDLVICWTRGGKEVGGTATAIKLAKLNNIRIINLAIEEFDFAKIY